MVSTVYMEDSPTPPPSRQYKLAELLTDVLMMQFVQEHSAPVKKFVKASIPAIKMMLGKEVADMMGTVMSGTPNVQAVFEGLHLDRFTEEELTAVSEWLRNAAFKLAPEPPEYAVLRKAGIPPYQAPEYEEAQAHTTVG